MIYKVLDSNGRSYHGGGSAVWSLPVDGQPGAWMPPIEGELKPCKNGYHLCSGEEQLVQWLGPEIYEAEYQSERVDADDKIVVREARLLRRIETWTKKTARLFSCDCAERVVRYYEAKYPGDNRPRKSIEIARRYARGEATDDELLAAESAAWYAWYAAESAAGFAAGYAVGSAAGYAWYAGYAAEFAAERRWQAERLGQYLRGKV